VIIGVTREIMTQERRVAIIPAGVAELSAKGHKVLIEKGAGEGSLISDQEYRSAGAELLGSSREVFERADFILKVKEPLGKELDYLREDQLLFTYLHLAADEELTRNLLDKKITAFGYETVQFNGRLPLLTPMSEVAGRMAVICGAHYLQSPYGGRGVMVSGVPGVRSAEIVIIGAGVVGMNALKIAVGLGASVTILDIDSDRLRYLDDLFGSKVKTLISNPYNLAGALERADLLIGAVLIPGGRTPVLINREMLKLMPDGSVLVDVSVDQGGCVETSRETTHDDPVFLEEGVIHYCVSNMPGAVPATSTFALCNATLPYVVRLAELGVFKSLESDPALVKGLNLMGGKIYCTGVAEAFNMECETSLPGIVLAEYNSNRNII